MDEQYYKQDIRFMRKTPRWTETQTSLAKKKQTPMTGNNPHKLTWDLRHDTTSLHRANLTESKQFAADSSHPLEVHMKYLIVIAASLACAAALRVSNW